MLVIVLSGRTTFFASVGMGFSFGGVHGKETSWGNIRWGGALAPNTEAHLLVLKTKHHCVDFQCTDFSLQKIQHNLESAKNSVFDRAMFLQGHRGVLHRRTKRVHNEKNTAQNLLPLELGRCVIYDNVNRPVKVINH